MIEKEKKDENIQHNEGTDKHNRYRLISVYMSCACCGLNIRSILCNVYRLGIQFVSGHNLLLGSLTDLVGAQISK